MVILKFWCHKIDKEKGDKKRRIKSHIYIWNTSLNQWRFWMFWCHKINMKERRQRMSENDKSWMKYNKIYKIPYEIHIREKKKEKYTLRNSPLNQWRFWIFSRKFDKEWVKMTVSLWSTVRVWWRAVWMLKRCS